MASCKNYFEDIKNVQPGSVPRLDFHLHTSWTDGKHSVSEMYEKACSINMEAILFSEHARKSSGDWFLKFADEVRSLPNAGTRALVGVETKIDDFNGNLDSTDEILSACDLVMASVHRFPGEKGAVRGFGDVDPNEASDLEFKLAMLILDHPKVDILAHPFGMCYRRYNVDPKEDQILQLIEKAAKTQVAFEINSHYHPDPWKWIKWCQKAGAKISLGSNAHSKEEIGRITQLLELGEGVEVE